MIAGSAALSDFAAIIGSFLLILWLFAFLVDRITKRKQKKPD